MADTYLAYIDEATDPENYLCIFSTLLIPVHEWHMTFTELKRLRKELERSDQLYTGGEWHARDFVTGRGYISPKGHPVGKARRAELFKTILHWIAETPTISVINALYPLRDSAGQIQLLDTFTGLILGINRTMQARNGFALAICDAGHEKDYRNVVRVLGETGRIDRIVEDTFFKSSGHSYFIQLADFCGYALLRREAPTPVIRQYGADTAFNLLEESLVKTELGINDPEGIIRPGYLG